MDDGEARIFDDKCIEDCPYHCYNNWKYTEEDRDGIYRIRTDTTFTFTMSNDNYLFAFCMIIRQLLVNSFSYIHIVIIL